MNYSFGFFMCANLRINYLMNKNLLNRLLFITGIISIGAALWHLLCIWGGISWFIFARAPNVVIQSVQQGTLLAPTSTMIVASLMIICGLYAFSCAQRIRKLPLLKSAAFTIALLCLMRVVLVLPTLWQNNFNDLWQVVATSVWLFVGMSFVLYLINRYIKKYKQKA